MWAGLEQLTMNIFLFLCRCGRRGEKLDTDGMKLLDAADGAELTSCFKFMALECYFIENNTPSTICQS